MAVTNMRLLIAALACVRSVYGAERPHVVFIMADDLGFNDVGFHGSNEIPTPNIDALAFSGLILQNYYVAPICTPSRSALMTGKHPIRTGMQHAVIYGAEPRGLPLSEKLLPQFLKELGYRTHLVGKWHLGSYKRVYTPLYRGFESHVGFWTGRIDYYDHTSQEHGSWGFDIRRGMEVAHDLFGQYITDVITTEAVKVIENHNKNESLFLMVSHSAVHSGNPYTPLRAPDLLVDSFNISDPNRRRFAGMLTKLDESVGEVIAALSRRELLEDSVIVFTTDNGGPAAGFNLNAASNYPLKGVKATLWEGGVRGAGLLWSPRLSSAPRVATQNMHITDWLPTLYAAAGGETMNLPNLDGKNVWASLMKDTMSPRSDVLHNIDDIVDNAALTQRGWKVMKGRAYNGAYDSWYGPAGREGHYDAEEVVRSKAGKAVAALHLLPDLPTMEALRTEATVTCVKPADVTPCLPVNGPCLFNVALDPCEYNNLAAKEPEKLNQLLFLLEHYNKTAVRPSNLPDDPRGDPKLWNHVYTNFGDYISCM